MVRAVQHFGLETIAFEDETEQMGVWDGSNFLVTVGSLTNTTQFDTEISSRLEHKATLAKYGKT